MATDALRELLALFTIDVESSKLKEADGEISEFLHKAKEVGKGLAEAFAVREVYEFVQGQIEAGTQLERTALRIGTTIEELQALHLAAQEAGVSVESMDTAFRFLNRNIAEGSAQRGEFSKLGISLQDAAGKAKPAADVMSELSDKMASIEDPAKRTQIAMQLLGRGGAELIPILSKGGEAFRSARKDLEELGGGISEGFVEQAKKAEEEQAKLSIGFRTLKSDIAIELLPGLRWLTDGVKDLVKGVIELEKRSHVIRDAVQLGTIALATAGVLKLVAAFRSLTAAELASAALNPFVWAAVGIAAVLLAYNDLKVALEGGKSVFSDLFGQSGIDTLRTGILRATEGWDIFKAGVSEVWTIVKFIYNSFVATVSLIGEAVGKLQTLLDLGDGVSKFFHGQSEAAENRAAGNLGDLGKPTENALNRIDEREEAANYAGSSPGYGFAPPIYQIPGASAAGGGALQPISIVNNFDTEVHASGGGDPSAIGAAVGSALATGQQRAHNNALQAVSKP